ncbi:hypothetical protein [Scytonema sp. PRP1]
MLTKKDSNSIGGSENKELEAYRSLTYLSSLGWVKRQPSQKPDQVKNSPL